MNSIFHVSQCAVFRPMSVRRGVWSATLPHGPAANGSCTQLRRCKFHAVPESGDQLPSSSEQASTSSSGAIGDLGFKAFVSEAEWRKIDEKVNKYPGQRTFSAIGTGGDDFKASMLAAVESVVGPVHVECVSQRPSSNGKYISIRIGPVWVQNSDQVIQVFKNMRDDSRLKWFM